MRHCRIASTAVAFVVMAGCGRLGFEPTALERDAGAADAASLPNASPDAAPPGLACSQSVDQDTVALYDFDDDVGTSIVERRGENPGTIIGAVAHTASAAPECGQALLFAGSLTDYVLIPDSQSWVLPSGSVDFWFRLDILPATEAALLTKDASGTQEDGHLTVWVDAEGRLASRHQVRLGPNEDGMLCSPPDSVLVGEWNHLAVNFGIAMTTELLLNGAKVNSPGTSMSFPCERPLMSNIDNREPWALGISAVQSDPGVVTPSERPLTGAIDHLRIRNKVQDYSGPEYRR